jgi:hypothetical protein
VYFYDWFKESSDLPRSLKKVNTRESLVTSDRLARND